MSIIESQQAAWEIKKAQRSSAAALLHANHPELVPAGSNSLVAAAKNIRRELSVEFRGCKFEVRSSRFSGGDSIDVRWADGPTSQQVDAIIGKYAAGSFDGMTDCYDYSHTAWTDAFGDAKYVHSHRNYSDKFLNSVLSRVARYWGVDPAPTADDYKQGRIWNFRVPNCGDFQRECHVALSRHTCYATAIATDSE
jgi:hypothetical protein